jgi:hypothetical protein
MIEQQQSQLEQTTTEDIVTSLEQPYKTVVDSLLSMQALQLEVVQRFWLSWMELLMLPWRQSARQQTTFQRLMATPMEPYVDWMFAPLTFSRKLIEASMEAMQRERERERIP